MLVAYLLATSLPGLIAAIGLLKLRPWARVLGIVAAVLYLIHIPFGTAVGAYAIWVLVNKDTERLLGDAPATASEPPLLRGSLTRRREQILQPLQGWASRPASAGA